MVTDNLIRQPEPLSGFAGTVAKIFETLKSVKHQHSPTSAGINQSSPSRYPVSNKLRTKIARKLIPRPTISSLILLRKVAIPCKRSIMGLQFGTCCFDCSLPAIQGSILSTGYQSSEILLI